MITLNSYYDSAAQVELPRKRAALFSDKPLKQTH
jgi:hypothetical protein